MSSNVISVGYNQKEIFIAIKKQIAHGHYKKNTLYGDGFAGEKMAKILSKINVNTTKNLIILIKVSRIFLLFDFILLLK